MADKVYVAIYVYACDDPYVTDRRVVGVAASFQGAIDILKSFRGFRTSVAIKDKVLSMLADCGPDSYAFDSAGVCYRDVVPYGCDGIQVLVMDLVL